MVKNLAISLVLSLISCSNDYEVRYIPSGQDEPINVDWFDYMDEKIELSYHNISIAQKELRDNAKTWDMAIPFVIMLSINMESCLNDSNTYNLEAINFDEATFILWELPKYREFEKCY